MERDEKMRIGEVIYELREAIKKERQYINWRLESNRESRRSIANWRKEIKTFLKQLKRKPKAKKGVKCGIRN